MRNLISKCSSPPPLCPSTMLAFILKQEEAHYWHLQRTKSEIIYLVCLGTATILITYTVLTNKTNKKKYKIGS